jgi:hypothetical protein
LAKPWQTPGKLELERVGRHAQQGSLSTTRLRKLRACLKTGWETGDHDDLELDCGTVKDGASGFLGEPAPKRERIMRICESAVTPLGHGQKVACRISWGGVSCDESRGLAGGDFPGGPGSGVIPGLEGRRKGDAKKVKVARRLRQETTMTLSWIAERLKMGRAGSLGNLLRNVKG